MNQGESLKFNNIQVVYMHSRLNVSGVLKDLLNKGHS